MSCVKVVTRILKSLWRAKRAMAADYCVKVSAGEASVGVGELAARVARLAGRRASEIEAMLEAGEVSIADSLSYAESLELQRELMRLKIPSKVVSEVASSGASLLHRSALGAKSQKATGGEGGVEA